MSDASNSTAFGVPTPSANRRAYLKALILGIAGVFLERNHSKEVYSKSLDRSASSDKSVQLHIYIDVKPGKGPDLEKLYHSAYLPAIKIQDGFLGSRLLRHYDSTSKYEIDISFVTEKQRSAWAQSKQHEEAWPKIEAVASRISWQGFDVLA